MEDLEQNLKYGFVDLNCFATALRVDQKGLRDLKMHHNQKLDILYYAFMSLWYVAFYLIHPSSCTYVTLVCKYFENGFQCTNL